MRGLTPIANHHASKFAVDGVEFDGVNGFLRKVRRAFRVLIHVDSAAAFDRHELRGVSQCASPGDPLKSGRLCRRGVGVGDESRYPDEQDEKQKAGTPLAMQQTCVHGIRRTYHPHVSFATRRSSRRRRIRNGTGDVPRMRHVHALSRAEETAPRRKGKAF